MVKTDTQVEEEIKELRRLLPKVVRRSLFGDDNHAAIEAQIRVLEERLDEDDIDDEFDDEYVRSNAQEAFNWRTGEEADAEDPSSGWSVLV